MNGIVTPLNATNDWARHRTPAAIEDRTGSPHRTDRGDDRRQQEEQRQAERRPDSSGGRSSPAVALAEMAATTSA